MVNNKKNKKTQKQGATVTPESFVNDADDLVALAKAHPLFSSLVLDATRLFWLLSYCNFKSCSPDTVNLLPELRLDTEYGVLSEKLYDEIVSIASGLPLDKDYDPITWRERTFYLSFDVVQLSDDDDSDSDSDGGPRPPSDIDPDLLNVSDSEFLAGVMHTADAGDLSKLNMMAMHGYLTRGMSNLARDTFNSILKMKSDDAAKVCWALKMGNVAMMAAPLTDDQIKAAMALGPDQWIDPYDYNTVLNDTIVTRVCAQAGYEFYTDPGCDDKRVVICHIGAVIIHTKKNVAFNIEENHYVLKRFMSVYGTDNSDVARLVVAKHALLPKDPVDGVFMKYRPKRAKVVLDNKRVDTTRFDFTIRKAGSYPEVAFNKPADFDYLAIAMVSVGPSDMALFSAVAATPAGKHVLDRFAASAHKLLPKATMDDLRDYVHRAVAMVDGSAQSYGDYYSVKVLDAVFETKLVETMLVTIAKDKGISGDIGAILQPYGCCTLQIAEACYSLNPTFALAPWTVYSGVDVANMLHLNVEACDNLTAPSRNGDCKPMATVKPSTSFVTRGVTKAARFKYEVPAGAGDYYMDLAFNCSRIAVSDIKSHVANMAKNKLSKMDHFAHDYRDTDGCCINLLNKKKGSDGFLPRFKMFVVVFPIMKLTPAYCKALFSVYDIRAVLGSFAMNFSVYLIGSSLEGPPKNVGARAVSFASKCSDMVYRRLTLFGAYYQGYPESPRASVELTHDVLTSAGYVTSRLGLYPSNAFLSIFGKAKKTLIDHTSVLTATPDINFEQLSDTVDEEFRLDYGVTWVEDPPLPNKADDKTN